jgi:imidazole glycerol-phosphate synthase subunit HisF
MFRPRVIPVLLLRDQALVKSQHFTDFRYVGDPLNAVKILNGLKADELVFLDTQATAQNRCISLTLVKDIGEEANMPFAVGGGIRTLLQIRDVIGAGAEKVVLGTSAIERPELVREAADSFGAATVVVCLDVKKSFLGKAKVYSRNGSRVSAFEPRALAQEMERLGAGELIIQSIDRDGTGQGYDLALVKEVSSSVSIPVTALGGAGHLGHLREAFVEGKASGLAAGSLFVFHGTRKGVLVNYPRPEDLIR